MSPPSGALPPGRALVTGAARRLGRAMALALAEDGWSVAVHFYGSESAAEETAEAARGLGAPTAAILRADLATEAETARLVARAAEALGGPLTLLVNNAALFERDEALTATRESWDRHLEANLRAPFVLSQSFAAQAPEASEAGGEPVARGLIVNMLDERVVHLTPHFLSYTVAKSGLWSLTRTLAMALAPAIRVNGIGPGPTLPAPRQSPEHFARMRAEAPLRRGAGPEDVVAALRYLVAAPAVTGQMIALDGGKHLNWRP